MNLPIKVYHELKKVSPEKARMLVRKVLEQNDGNVSKTARILGISRHTVRRARDGSLHDLPRAPKHIPHKTSSDLENLIVQEAKRTGFRYVRLSKYLRCPPKTGQVIIFILRGGMRKWEGTGSTHQNSRQR